MNRDAAAVEWLLSSDEPAVRFLTRRDVLGEDAADDEARILRGPKVRALLSGQQPNGDWERKPYAKWGGAHWRLVALVELCVPADDKRVVAALNRELDWLTSPGRWRTIRVVNGLPRRCASIEGNGLVVACRLGFADDARVRTLVDGLLEWQWPDGGWNCDDRASGRRSSFHETLIPMWGLHEYASATGDDDAQAAAERAAELFLDHRLFRASKTGEPIHSSFVQLHYPPYWHYDVLQALLVLSRMGLAGDERARDALDLLEEKRLADGRWKADAYWWRRVGSRSSVDPVDWGRGGPNEMITLNALRVLTAARAQRGEARAQRRRQRAKTRPTQSLRR